MSRQDGERQRKPDWSKLSRRSVNRRKSKQETKVVMTDGVSDQGVRFIFVVAVVAAVFGGLSSLIKLLLGL
ncbi:MAG: hypothetical protein UW94_C0003G0013 [Parcubacteria group bacterium GW2011_GWA2_45_14]|nr:MAG: hypothetical protein UW94_C0003G0013 [Parcubacteria group bacterium GW2011_GWA2_45_14]